MVLKQRELLFQFEAMNAKLATAGYLNAGELATAKELAEENVQWSNKNYAVIERWLEQHVKSGAMRFEAVSVMAVTIVAVLSAVLL